MSTKVSQVGIVVEGKVSNGSRISSRVDQVVGTVCGGDQIDAVLATVNLLPGGAGGTVVQVDAFVSPRSYQTVLATIGEGQTADRVAVSFGKDFGDAKRSDLWIFHF